MQGARSKAAETVAGVVVGALLVILGAPNLRGPTPAEFRQLRDPVLAMQQYLYLIWEVRVSCKKADRKVFADDAALLEALAGAKISISYGPDGNPRIRLSKPTADGEITFSDPIVKYREKFGDVSSICSGLN